MPLPEKPTLAEIINLFFLQADMGRSSGRGITTWLIHHTPDSPYQSVAIRGLISRKEVRPMNVHKLPFPITPYPSLQHTKSDIDNKPTPLEALRYAIALYREAKPNDRSNVDRHYARLLTKLEEAEEIGDFRIENAHVRNASELMKIVDILVDTSYTPDQAAQTVSEELGTPVLKGADLEPLGLFVKQCRAGGLGCGVWVEIGEWHEQDGYCSDHFTAYDAPEELEEGSDGIA